MAATEPDRQGSPRELFARLMQTVLAYDMNGQADLFAADGVLEWPFAPPGLPRRIVGREEIRRVLSPLGERAQGAGRRRREYSSIVTHDTTDPTVIIVEFTVSGESASGEPFQLPYIQVLRVRNGEIDTFRDYWNPLELMALLDADAASAKQTPD